MSAVRTEHLAEGVTLYLGDCREILPGLPRPDALISDPPYGIAHVKGSGGHGQHSRRNIAPIVGDASPFDPGPLLVFDNVLIWGAEHYCARLPADEGRWLAWNKLDDMESYDSFSDVEFAWHSRGGAARIFNYKWKGIASVKAGEAAGRDHPTQKPIGLMKWCIAETRTPPLRLSARSVYGLRHYRSRRRQARPQVHRHRDRTEVFRHRLSANLRGASPARHVHREAQAPETGDA